MELRRKILGRDKISKKMRQIVDDLNSDSESSELSKSLAGAAHLVRTDAVKSISRGSRTGRFYKKTKSGKKHQASAPGEFPKTDTGELVSNITVERIRGGYDVGSRAHAPQGYYLETKSSARGGRPWLRPTIEKNAKKIQSIIRSALKKAMQK